MKDYNDAMANLENRFKELKVELKEAKKLTQEVLNECGRQGIKCVSIGKKTDKIKSTQRFSFGCSGSIFADERTKEGEGSGFPAIWRVAEKTGIGGGCGNSGQYQVKRDANLMEGVYELKGKTWRKVE